MNLITTHRRIEKDKIRNLRRAVQGRYCWDPSIRDILEGAHDAHEPDPTDAKGDVPNL